MVDIFGAFCFNSGFSEKELEELEDIGMKLQEQALELLMNKIANLIVGLE